MDPAAAIEGSRMFAVAGEVDAVGSRMFGGWCRGCGTRSDGGAGGVLTGCGCAMIE